VKETLWTGSDSLDTWKPCDLSGVWEIKITVYCNWFINKI
jgi:hypothetical protein